MRTLICTPIIALSLVGWSALARTPLIREQSSVTAFQEPPSGGDSTKLLAERPSQLGQRKASKHKNMRQSSTKSSNDSEPNGSELSGSELSGSELSGSELSGSEQNSSVEAGLGARSDNRIGHRTWMMATRGNPVLASVNPSEELHVFRVGQIVRALIPHSLIAFGHAKAPVSAVVESFKGGRFILIGEATLEGNSKRILVEFTRVRREPENTTFEIKAHALDQIGVLGLQGKHESGEGKYFAGELTAAAAAGFADAAVNRSSNLFGQIQEENSLDTKAKKALGVAMSRTADRFAEKSRQAPEYSVLNGPIEIQMLIIDQPRRRL